MKTYDSKDSGSPDPMPMLWRCWFCGWPIFSGGSDSSGVFDVSLCIAVHLCTFIGCISVAPILNQFIYTETHTDDAFVQ